MSEAACPDRIQLHESHIVVSEDHVIVARRYFWWPIFLLAFFELDLSIDASWNRIPENVVEVFVLRHVYVIERVVGDEFGALPLGAEDDWFLCVICFIETWNWQRILSVSVPIAEIARTRQDLRVSLLDSIKNLGTRMVHWQCINVKRLRLLVLSSGQLLLRLLHLHYRFLLYLLAIFMRKHNLCEFIVVFKWVAVFHPHI